ncbi:MAG: 30S ribosomal protein S4 [Christensenellaceae bacterium]|jgi:small subunit ribosomal protein S4|nr:30S ribosomal protein S4 [Christensenellaceae bacterium]
MAKYTGPVCKLCRREGAKLFLKGDRCYGRRCAMEGSAIPPGQHGGARKKATPYSVQLREKQKAKRAYGLLEKQFHMYYEKAEKMRGITGENMFVLIERRLDNVVYRMGIGSSRAQSRQIVNHRHITVNGNTVDIPSYLVKTGDIIAIKETKREKPIFVELKGMKLNNLPKWLTFDTTTLSGQIIALPTRADLDLTISEHMIVELYSK